MRAPSDTETLLAKLNGHDTARVRFCQKCCRYYQKQSGEPFYAWDEPSCPPCTGVKTSEWWRYVDR